MEMVIGMGERVQKFLSYVMSRRRYSVAAFFCPVCRKIPAQYAVPLLLCLLCTAPAFSQEDAVQLWGRVVSADGSPVEHASVALRNTRFGTVADGKGRYILPAPAGEYTLVVSAMGYATVERPLSLRSRQSLMLELIPDEKEIEEVTVVGKSAVRQVNESAFNVVAIDAKPLHNTSMSLTHALDRISGVKIRETGGVGSNTQVALNGFSGRHVKMFMDGVPMEGFGASFQLNNIPVNLAERIEVYKGVVPVELGADALGGAVNIVTRQLRSTYVDASYAYGSFNTHRSNFSVGHTAKSGLTFQLNAYQTYSDNSYRVKTQLLDVATNTYSQEKFWFRRFHDGYRNEAVVGRVGVTRKPWADRLLLSVTLSQEKAEIQNANLMKIVYGGRERKAQSAIPSLHYEKKNLIVPNLHFSLTTSYSISRNNNIDTLARQYSWNGEYRQKSARGEGQYSMGEYNNSVFNATANLRYRFADMHHVSLSNLYSDFNRKATDAAANSENSVAATFMRRTSAKNVAGISYRIQPSDRWSASVFAKRYDVLVRGPVDVSTVTSSAVYEEQGRSFSTEGYGLGATYRILPSLHLKVSFEKSYRLPSENELFGDESLETGDVGLKPENSHNINFNICYDRALSKAHTVYFDVGLIYRDTKDYIRRQIEQRYGGAYYANHGQVRNLGFDVEARYFYRRVSVGGNFTFQDIRNMEQYAVGGRKLIYYKDRMPNVPYLFGNADATCNFYNPVGRGSVLSATYNLRYIHSFFRNWESEGGDIIIPSQLSHDLTLTLSLRNGRYHIAGEARNITDEMLYDNYSLQKPGRSFMLKLRYFFFKQ
ncbi:MAG: TonB-dependent receptor plug domain-containing protein [Prevotellaceae bacterium]|jgi:outer membrane cobalamin receptor|nr:TonB-dependent receptor plug domain-containing protein [Prevotellaceae bacterium]